MPGLRPSEIVQAIDNLFGPSRNELQSLAIKHFHQVEVRTLLSLLDDMPRDLLRLPPVDLVEFMRCRAVLAAAVARWSFGDTQPSPNVGSRDPVERIRRLLAQCPDELPPPEPELMFIADENLRAGIEDRIRAAWTSFKVEEWIGATVLAGTALEALLLWKIKQFNTTGSHDFDQLHLAQLISELAKRKLLSEEAAGQARLAKDARNLMHPGRASRSGTECSKATALTGLAGVYRVADEFKRQTVSARPG